MTTPFQLKAGYGALMLTAKTDNGATTFRVNKNGYSSFFEANMWRLIERKVDGRLMYGNVTLAQDSVIFSFEKEITTLKRYTVQLRYSRYKIKDLWGVATGRLECDFTKQEHDAPYFTSFKILNEGYCADELNVGTTSEITFEVRDDAALRYDSTRLFVKDSSSTVWTNLPLSRQGNIFTYSTNDIPGISGYVSVRVRAVDSSGNAVDYTMSPGFFYHRIQPSVPSLFSPSGNAADQPTIISLKWNKSFATAMYHLQVATDSNFSSLIINDSTLAGTSLKMQSLAKATTYYWRVRGINSLGVSDFSEFRKFTTTPDETYLYSIRERWNLLSLPLKMQHGLQTSAFISATSVAYTFNGVSYIPNDTLRNSVGYWMKSKAVDTVVIVGKLTSHDTINVMAGWNIIGAISYPVESSGIGSIPPGIGISLPYEYNNGYTTSSTLYPGKGYWVYSTQEGKLVLSFNPGTGTGKARIVAISSLPPSPPDVINGSDDREIPEQFKLEQNYPNPF
ncbi:MAG: fibronectin type III domain-containing protein, partial [Bacteroidetes bacterium]